MNTRSADNSAVAKKMPVSIRPIIGGLRSVDVRAGAGVRVASALARVAVRLLWIASTNAGADSAP